MVKGDIFKQLRGSRMKRARDQRLQNSLDIFQNHLSWTNTIFIISLFILSSFQTLIGHSKDSCNSSSCIKDSHSALKQCRELSLAYFVC